MDIKSIGMRIAVLWRENTDIIVDSTRLIAVAFLFFGSGILYAQHFLFPSQSFTIRQVNQNPVALQANIINAVSQKNTPTPIQTSGAYVASKNGKNYYKVSCSNRIKEENKVYFTTIDDAKKAGYTASATCFR